MILDKLVNITTYRGISGNLDLANIQIALRASARAARARLW